MQRNKILREVMAIPSLVKAVDLFDKDVLILAKKTNVITLLLHTKLQCFILLAKKIESSDVNCTNLNFRLI